MGTTRIKVIDLSSNQGQIKTSRKHAEKLSGLEKLKGKKPQKQAHHPKDDQPIVQKDQKPLIAQTADISEATGSDVASPSEITETPTLRPTDTTESSEFSEPSQPSKSSLLSHPSTHHKGKKYLQAKKNIENKLYKIKEALEILPKTSTTSFDPSVEIHLNVVDQKIKGSIKFPHPFKEKKGQKQTRYLIFSDQQPAKSDQRPIIWGDEKTINDIESATLKPGKAFDVVIASPKFMPKLAKIAKILGPRGMMPNPKNGSITEDFEKAISQGNSEDGYSFKSDPNNPIVHAKIGQLSQKPNELEKNLKALVLAIGKSRIKKATLTSTMGPPVKLDTASL